MKIKIETLDILLSALSKKTKQSLDYYGFGKMSEKIGGSITQRYLSERLLAAMNKAVKAGKKVVSLNTNKANELARYLDSNSIEDFIAVHESTIDNQLSRCSGSYYSYVRRNLTAGRLYRSPAKIFESEGKMIMELKGGRLKYSAELRIQLGCLFAPLETKEGKAFYHVYKIGKAESPEILQGTFSGISNAEDPIAGRAVLQRVKEKFENLKNQEMNIAEMRKSKALDQRRLAEYFEKFSENNLSLKKSYSFRIDDLGVGE